jgi:hypothetical protein
VASGRTDSYVAVVCNDDTLERWQYVGAKKEVEEQAAAKVKELGKANTRIILERRPK